jgi:hypothetical protein
MNSDNMNDIEDNNYDNEEDIRYEEEMDRKWMMADMLEYQKNYEQFRTKNNDKFILTDEDASKNTGYIIEHYGNCGVHVTFWICKGDDEKYEEKRGLYNSMKSLYDDSKRFMELDLINDSLLQQSKYKMMYDFIKYYDEQYVKINKK